MTLKSILFLIRFQYRSPRKINIYFHYITRKYWQQCCLNNPRSTLNLGVSFHKSCTKTRHILISRLIQWWFKLSAPFQSSLLILCSRICNESTCFTFFRYPEVKIDYRKEFYIFSVHSSGTDHKYYNAKAVANYWGPYVYVVIVIVGFLSEKFLWSYIALIKDHKNFSPKNPTILWSFDLQNECYEIRLAFSTIHFGYWTVSTGNC